jgi:hypothetical protein
MSLVHDIMNMQKCGGVIITQDNEHVEVDRVAGILSQEIHQYVQLDSLGKFKLIPLETIKEARPLSLDYELPYPRGNDEDYYDKDGEDDSFELLGNEDFNDDIIEEGLDNIQLGAERSAYILVYDRDDAILI